MCHAVESGARQVSLQQGGRLYEDYLNVLTRSLKLSSGLSVIIGFSLAQSQFKSLSQDAIRFLRVKLPELNSLTAISDMSEDILQQIYHFITTCEVWSVASFFEKYFGDSRHICSFYQQELATQEISGPFVQALRSHPLFGGMKPEDTMGRQRLSIASVLAEMGPRCSVTQDVFAKTLVEIGIPIDEQQIAEIMVTVLPKLHIVDAEKWNLDVVADVMSMHGRGLNWVLVTQKLDQPNLSIRSEHEFLLITRFFVRISGIAMPGAGLVRLWSNRTAQLSILILGIKAPRQLIDFSSLVAAEQILPSEVPLPPNFSLACIPLYLVLIELASVGLAAEVQDALGAAAGAFPEYILIGLAQVQDVNSGVRGEILRRTLPLFTGLPGSRPTSLIVMKRLQIVNPDLLVLLFRIALKKSTTLQDIVEIDSRLRILGEETRRRLEEEGNVDELLGYLCVRADKAQFQLEEWVNSVLERSAVLARSVIGFVKVHAEHMRPRVADEGGLLSFESFAILVRAVHTHAAAVPVEEMRAFAALVAQYGGFAKAQQQQQQQQQQLAAAVGMHANPLGQQLPQQPGDLTAEDLSRPPESDEVEEEANAYFQRIYASDISIDNIIMMLKKFKTSDKQREQEIFRCMIHNLFDEYRFFHKYPERELLISARLFGALIQNQLVSSITLGIALRYVLEALRKDPEANPTNERMFRFGKLALEQFRNRLIEWPQYCSHLVQITHFAGLCLDLYQEAQRAISSTPTVNAPGEGGASAISTPASMQAPLLSAPQTPASAMTPGMPSLGAAAPALLPPGPAVKPLQQPDPVKQLPKQMGGLSLDSKPEETPSAPLPGDTGLTPSQSATPSIVVSDTPGTLGSGITGAEAFKTEVSGEVAVPPADELPRVPTVIDRMLAVNINTDLPTTPAPADNVRDQVFFIVNNIARDNLEPKTEELRGLLEPAHFQWFANYLVVKRVSTMPNLHPTYLTLLDSLNWSELFKAILDTTYYNATKLLSSPSITSSSSERSLLRNLGIWLGQITLARNKPLLQRRINLKELLIWGFESARLIAVCSFVAKIIEGCKDSIIFRPPNPWLMPILSVMRELYELEDLKMNIKFEVQVLCKNINIKIEDIPRGNLLSTAKTPVKDQRNPDFTVKPASATPVPSAGAGQGTPAPVPTTGPALPTLSPLTQSMSNSNFQYSISAGVGASPALAALEENDDKNAALEQTVIPNLAAFVNINASLEYFAVNPNQRRLVAIAVDRAIREIIQPVVERSVSIANVTTKMLVLKDFCSEPNEQLLRNGAHLMVSNLAGSLALVTCKEPLRISISNHLRTLLASAIPDQTVLENIVQICANDNLELGCILIEKASTERAVRDVDESIASAIQIRRKHRETGQPFIDVIAAAAKTSLSKYPRELPEQLKPHIGGLLPQQLAVFEAFQRPRATPQINSQQSQDALAQQGGAPGADKSAGGAAGAAGLNQQQPLLNMAQALDAYQTVLARLDMSLKGVQTAAAGREVTIAMLGANHEILALLRELITITQRTQPTVRSETAMTFCENVFRRLLENSQVMDFLRSEVMIGIIEALRDACGGAKKFTPDVVSWLNNYSSFNANDETARNVHRSILLLLLRAKLLRTQDVDAYFATNMDGGKNISWVELALNFIHQCLSEGLAATYEFTSTFDTVSKMRPANATVRKQLQKWLTDLRALAASKDEQKSAASSATTPSSAVAGGGNVAGAAGAPTNVRDASVREHVTVLLERWLRVWTSTNDHVFGQYLQLMHQYGVLKTEDAADRFFRIATELCVEACLKSGQALSQPGADSASSNTPTNLALTVIDALSKLFLLLVRLADKEAGDITVRVNLLGRILNAIARTLVEDHEAKKTSGATFDQRPYFRLLSNLYQDLGVADSKAEPNQVMVPLLATFCQVYFILQPSTLPGFAFAWLQLISHRCFMPHLLLAKGQKCWPYMHRLLVAMMLFLQPFLKSAQLNESIRRLYKGTLRVLLVLLHDFPEFLCDYHLSFCDVIPNTCVQLRNLILSAFPRTMRLPDPFTPNLKVDLLPEIQQSPRILTDYVGVLTERGIRQRLDSYILSKQPPDLPSNLPSVVITPSASGSGVTTNAALLTSIVVYVGNQAIVQLQTKVPLQNSPAMDIFKALVAALDAEGRYHLFNAMANQLRYPNSHTHYFSCVLLMLFADAESEFIQEQITRVLLERLIVHRPHPVSFCVMKHTNFVDIDDDVFCVFAVGLAHHFHRAHQELSLRVLAPRIHPLRSRDRASL
jgi:CCR4-NOT transcription complex subunit 1